MAVSCLYRGQVMHHRLDPIGHRFNYNVMSMLIDLDEICQLGLRLFSHNKFNLFSIQDRDLGDGADPRSWIEGLLSNHGIAADGPVRIHLFPRLLGRGFTPLTTWFCHDADERLSAILYQVHNTFGERHSYLVPAMHTASRTVMHKADKHFHVSPLIAPEGVYRFTLRPPGESFAQTIRLTASSGQPTMIASYVGRRIELSDAALAGCAAAYPLLPLKIWGGIHLEALRLWLKGAPFFRKPPPPADAVSYCPQGESQ
ncbi:DUF1365 domain-containing protein [Lacibacterium aquatile]|uniref:DUF1365 domain-containing protein n=1 Tax=Lacibacterium aquatile TaxID=1168082 RepID=A0ABW5DRH4_9PROT